MDSNNITNVVTALLNSPELRRSLEETVRNVTSTTLSTPSQSHERNRSPSIRAELNRLFPSVNQTRSSRPERVIQSRKKYKTNNYYYKEVILLKSCRRCTTLKGSDKSTAFETGFALSDVKFDSSWGLLEVENHMKEIFNDLKDVNFELLVPMAGRLIKPSVDELSGSVIKRIFYQKPIYIRPKSDLEEGSQEHDDLDALQENEAIALERQEVLIEDSGVIIDESHILPFNNEEISSGNVTVIIAESEIVTENQRKSNENVAAIEEDSGTLTLEVILTNLQLFVKEDSISKFNIYREDIFNCCIRAMRRKTFDPFNKISVKFSDVDGTSEGAVDVGGPTREMFRLVLNHLKNSGLFIGTDKKYLTLNRVSLENNEYFEAGRLIALSLVHGGPGPHFFSTSLFQAISDGLYSCTPSQDFVDAEIQHHINEFSKIESLEESKNYIMEGTLFSTAGYYNIHSLNEKEKIIEGTLEFYNCHRIKPSYEQFINGLRTCNILQLVRDNPECFKPIMCGINTGLNATEFETLFQKNWSEVGSNKRATENRIICFWRDYLVDCEEPDAKVSLEDLLIFATGADRIPPLGFPYQPKVLIQDDNTVKYPKANTCGLDLQLPDHKTYEEFKLHMDLGISNCKDFAFA